MDLFKNRSIRMKLVKDDDPVVDPRPTWIWTPTEYNDVITAVARNTAQVIAIYVAADTLRKVVVYAISAKL